MIHTTNEARAATTTNAAKRKALVIEKTEAFKIDQPVDRSVKDMRMYKEIKRENRHVVAALVLDPVI